MITICPHCGSHEWNKQVREGTVFCPNCGGKWPLADLTLHLLTGCSGVGKTTTARALALQQNDFAVLDGDMYIPALAPMDQDKYLRAISHMLRVAGNYGAAGKESLWVQTGNLDQVKKDYFARFFREIRALALISEEDELRRRMRQGRGIEDAAWIESSVSYNRYFIEHDRIGDLAFDRLDVTNLSVREAAQRVRAWMKR